MSYMITQLLNEERVARVRSWLDNTDYWSDGTNSLTQKNTDEGREYKVNLELDRGHESYTQPSQIIYRALDRSKDFYNLCLPFKTTNIIFSRTSEGGFYKPHQDAFPHKVQPNPRMYTCIIALNDEYIGGETIFPNLNKSFKLNKGDVLLFNTLNDWGYHTQKALHGGTPVESGEKWICNLWIHQYPFEDDA